MIHSIQLLPDLIRIENDSCKPVGTLLQISRDKWEFNPFPEIEGRVPSIVFPTRKDALIKLSEMSREGLFG